MFKFLKKLYEQRLRKITVILLDDTKPGEDNSYTLRPGKLFSFIAFLCLVSTLIMALIFMFTPISSYLYNKEDQEIRAQIENVTRRIISLQDSLLVRDKQLSDMKTVIRMSVDTTLALEERFSSMFEEENDPYRFTENSIGNNSEEIKVGTSGLLFANIFKTVPNFPASYPVSGSLTRSYEPQELHFGIDIATNEGEIVTSLADGTIVSDSWTISEGYVLSIQHSNGILTVYKHCSSITKKSGDVVLKGDIIGTTGNVGVLSSGPHLHLEIWKDGLPQDPIIYLIQ